MNLGLESLLPAIKKEATTSFEQMYIAGLEAEIAIINADTSLSKLLQFEEGYKNLQKIVTVVEKNGVEDTLLDLHGDELASVINITSGMDKEVALENLMSMMKDTGTKMWEWLQKVWKWIKEVFFKALNAVISYYGQLMGGVKQIANASPEIREAAANSTIELTKTYSVIPINILAHFCGLMLIQNLSTITWYSKIADIAKFLRDYKKKAEAAKEKGEPLPDVVTAEKEFFTNTKSETIDEVDRVKTVITKVSFRYRPDKDYERYLKEIHKMADAITARVSKTSTGDANQILDDMVATINQTLKDIETGGIDTGTGFTVEHPKHPGTMKTAAIDAAIEALPSGRDNLTFADIGWTAEAIKYIEYPVKGLSIVSSNIDSHVKRYEKTIDEIEKLNKDIQALGGIEPPCIKMLPRCCMLVSKSLRNIYDIHAVTITGIREVVQAVLNTQFSSKTVPGYDAKDLPAVK